MSGKTRAFSGLPKRRLPHRLHLYASSLGVSSRTHLWLQPHTKRFKRLIKTQSYASTEGM
jgi:hypothetical protein